MWIIWINLAQIWDQVDNYFAEKYILDPIKYFEQNIEDQLLVNARFYYTLKIEILMIIGSSMSDQTIESDQAF